MPDDLEEKCICSGCVSEAFLFTQIEKYGKERVCSYCKVAGKTFSIEEMAEGMKAAIDDHFYQTPTEPSAAAYIMENEGLKDWERKGVPIAEVIQMEMAIPSEAAEDIRKILEYDDYEPLLSNDENPFEESACYAVKQVDGFFGHASWEHFEASIKRNTRFFNRVAEETLGTIFQDVSSHKTRDGASVIVKAGPGTKLDAIYRARMFESEKLLKIALEAPDKHIGPPPYALATAGRMNAHGISVFYGATDKDVAVSEVRPPVGSSVVVGRFEFIKPVRLLDMEALRSLYVTGSIFDREFKRRLELGEFLKWLSHRISMPVMPNDEPFSYLATQAIADFLAAGTDPDLDGIIYPSAQRSKEKSNVVLFHKAARVEEIRNLPGTKIHVYTYSTNEDGPEPDYWILEEIPSPEEVSKLSAQQESLSLLGIEEHDFEIETRAETLRLDITMLEVQYVKAVRFETEKYEVTRHSRQKEEPEF